MANLGANTPRPPNPPTTQRAHLHMRARACPRACACPGHCHTTPHPHKQAPHARKQHRHPQHILAIQAPQTTHDTTTHSACKPRCKHALRSPGPHEHCTQSTQRGAAGTKQRAAHASQRPRPTARAHLCTHHHTNEHHPTATPHTNTHTHACASRALAAVRVLATHATNTSKPERPRSHAEHTSTHVHRHQRVLAEPNPIHMRMPASARLAPAWPASCAQAHAQPQRRPNWPARRPRPCTRWPTPARTRAHIPQLTSSTQPAASGEAHTTSPHDMPHETACGLPFAHQPIKPDIARGTPVPNDTQHVPLPVPCAKVCARPCPPPATLRWRMLFLVT